MLFKKRTAPTFSQQSPDASQQQRPQLNHPQSHSPIQTGGKEQQPRQSQSLTTEQLAELQQFMQFSFQSVTDYQFLLEKMPNEHLASIIRNMIEDEKNTIKRCFTIINLTLEKNLRLSRPS